MRVRDGETLVSDGPFAEAKEWIAGFDLVECADLDEVIEVAAKGPVSWFKTIEIRPVADGPWLAEGASAFGRGQDGAARPYLLAVWTGGTAVAPGDQAVTREVTAWRQDLQARGLHILGAELEGADTASTLRVRGGKTLLGDGMFIKTGEFITGIDVVEPRGPPAGHPGRRRAPGRPVPRDRGTPVPGRMTSPPPSARPAPCLP